MPQETKAFNGVEEVRDFVSAGGKFLVLDQDTLQQIEDAEAQGGFEGGFTGDSDGAPFSGVGSGGLIRARLPSPVPTTASASTRRGGRSALKMRPNLCWTPKT
jgi:hypothetical protein